jgi:serine/threonine protein kinase
MQSGDASFQVLWQDAERIFSRGWREAADGERISVLAVRPAASDSSSDSLSRLAHEFRLKDTLDSTWALRPLEFVRERGVLFLEDRGGAPLAQLIGAPLEMGRFLRLAIALSRAVGRLHGSGLIHKDIKPGNVFVDPASGKCG